MFDKDLYEDDYVAAWDAFFEQEEPKSVVTRSQDQGSRPDARRRAAIMARKIISARRMMAAFGRPMKF